MWPISKINSRNFYRTPCWISLMPKNRSHPPRRRNVASSASIVVFVADKSVFFIICISFARNLHSFTLIRTTKKRQKTIFNNLRLNNLDAHVFYICVFHSNRFYRACPLVKAGTPTSKSVYSKQELYFSP